MSSIYREWMKREIESGNIIFNEIQQKQFDSGELFDCEFVNSIRRELGAPDKIKEMIFMEEPKP